MYRTRLSRPACSVLILIANTPPGVTKPVKLKLTTPGKSILRNNKKRRLKGMIEIRNTPGTAFDTTPVTIRLR